MSAFFVTKKTIDVVVMAMRPALMTNDDTANAFGRKLYEMNAEALRQRYQLDGTQELTDYLEEAKNYTFEEHKDISDAQLIKSMNCLAYQCCEGDVDESDLYQRLEKEIELQTEAVSKGRTVFQYGANRPFIKGYDEAQWDIT